MKGQGAAQASRKRTDPQGRKKTGRGRDEAAEATARPQERVDHTKAALSGVGDRRGTDKRGPPPSLETTVLTISLARGFPHPHLGSCPLTTVSPLQWAGSTTLTVGGGAHTEQQVGECACVCAREFVPGGVCARLQQSTPPTLRLKPRADRLSAGHSTTKPLPASLPGDPGCREAGNGPLLPQDILLALTPDQA